MFLERYKELEEVVRSTFNLKYEDSISYYLGSENKFKRYANDVRYCQEVRNLLSHKKKIDDTFAVEPTEQMIKFITQLIELIRNRARCSDIQIGISQVYWQPLCGSVKATMKEMRRKVFTHIPILEEGVVIGVFDENSVFSYLADEEIIEIDDNLTFNAIRKYLSVNGRDMEEFIFYKASGYVENLEIEFERAFKRGKRIGIVFLTQSGKPNEKLQGIITPWDIIAMTKQNAYSRYC